jgi:hypothetical protein
MGDHKIDWKRHDENYLRSTLGHYAVFERPDRKPEHRTPMQRVMRQIKELRGRRYWDHIRGDGYASLPAFMHESWFQLPATQKEERLLRHVDWSGVSEKTRDKLIAGQLRSRDGEINAQDEYRLHDQLMRVEWTTPGWSELSSTAKLDTLLHGRGVDWRPFPPAFQAVALGYMIRREVRPAKEGFEIVGVFEAGGEYPRFGRYSSSGRGGFEQSRDKGPKRPVFSKATARDQFRWAVEEPRWEAFVKEHGDADRAAFRDQMRPLWRDFWQAAKKLNRDGLTMLALDHSSQTSRFLEARQPVTPADLAEGKGLPRQQADSQQVSPAEGNEPAARQHDQQLRRNRGITM